MKRKNKNFNNRKYQWKKSRTTNEREHEKGPNKNEGNVAAETDIIMYEGDIDDDDDFDDYDDHDFYDDDLCIQRLTAMLPAVVRAFRQNQLIQYLCMFFTLVSAGTFDFKNICFLLFCDLLRFWSTKSTTQMRYPFEQTRQFCISF